MVKHLIGMLLIFIGTRLAKLGFKMSGSGGYIDIFVDKYIIAEEIGVFFMFGILAFMIFFMALFVF